MSVGNGPNRIQVKRSTAALAADPSKLAVQSTGAGWLLLFLEGEATPIGLLRLEGVAQFWQQFVRKYLADQPVTRRAA
jgi:hypothetical protein